MNNQEGFGLKEPTEPGHRGADLDDPHRRAVGSPLPIGSRRAAPLPGFQTDWERPIAASPPGRALANRSAAAPVELPAGIQRVANAVRAALPFVQRILPLLDGNIGAAVANILTPRHVLPPPPPPVNLTPIEEGLAELQARDRELRDQVGEQNASLKRVEDRLEMVREATDRNTLEQEELLQDLKGVGDKVKLFGLIALALLGVSIAINVILYLHIRRVLP